MKDNNTANIEATSKTEPDGPQLRTLQPPEFTTGMAVENVFKPELESVPLSESQAPEPAIQTNTPNDLNASGLSGTSLATDEPSEVAPTLNTDAAKKSAAPFFALVFTTLWNLRGVLIARLAAKQDADIRYITVSLGDLKGKGLLPNNHDLKHGDQVAILLNGKFTALKLNRKSGTTAAAHLPLGLDLPPWTESGSGTQSYDVVVIGPMRDAEIVVNSSSNTNELCVEKAEAIAESASFEYQTPR